MPWVDPDASDDEADVEPTGVPSTSGLSSAPSDFLEIHRTFVLKQIESKQQEIALLRDQMEIIDRFIASKQGGE